MGVVTKPARDSNAGRRSTVLHCCSGPCSVFIRVAEVLRASGSRTFICSTIVFFPAEEAFRRLSVSVKVCDSPLHRDARAEGVVIFGAVLTVQSVLRAAGAVCTVSFRQRSERDFCHGS